MHQQYIELATQSAMVQISKHRIHFLIAFAR